ncbi:hypothetical protein KW798_00145 [Candidatus Parcubacteria bacterium]|nr:hypothetical protein [Candidatus Parcubacteria bacterium]
MRALALIVFGLFTTVAQSAEITAHAPQSMRVTVMNPTPLVENDGRRVIGQLSFGDTCNVHFGESLIEKNRDTTDVLVVLHNDIYMNSGGRCIRGVLFFVPIKQFDTMERAYLTILRDDARKALERAKETLEEEISKSGTTGEKARVLRLLGNVSTDRATGTLQRAQRDLDYLDQPPTPHRLFPLRIGN